MPCTYPLQAIYSLRPDGKRNIRFSSVLGEAFRKGRSLDGFYCMAVPCGRCMSCRLEKSRQMALRCVHESKMYEDNCFVTLTYDPKFLPEGGTLVRKHTQNFMKSLRQKFSDRKIRVYGCGEYGDKNLRPHYHLCLFGHDFHDRERWQKDGDYWYHTSSDLSSLWPFGFTTTCDFSFETAAYVARYCTKKITGAPAKEHYGGRKPEFPIFSNKPGIGKPWLDKFGKSDVFPHDSVVARGVECKLPRYYDILWERKAPDEFAKAKEARRLAAEKLADDNTFDRLVDKEKCLQARFSKLIRMMEK